MNTDLLTVIAESCRNGLMTLSAAPISMFSGFPRACCGPAAEIVGRVLKEVAGYDGFYVCGSEHRDMKPNQTHAWYEVGDYIIDVTYDQFEGCSLNGWVFERGQGWHAQFASLDRRPGFCTSAGWTGYPYDGYAAVVDILALRTE